MFDFSKPDKPGESFKLGAMIGTFSGIIASVGFMTYSTIFGGYELNTDNKGKIKENELESKTESFEPGSVRGDIDEDGKTEKVTKLGQNSYLVKEKGYHDFSDKRYPDVENSSKLSFREDLGHLFGSNESRYLAKKDTFEFLDTLGTAYKNK